MHCFWGTRFVQEQEREVLLYKKVDYPPKKSPFQYVKVAGCHHGLRRMKMVCGDYNKCVNQIVINPQE